jgi:hypothetical protein
MDRVRYFAYGSNMQSATFAGRRGIVPTAALAARAPGWRLVLDKPPLVPMGVSFANLVPDPEAEAFGVLYEIGVDDLAHIELTEGVAIDNYRRAEIAVLPLATGSTPTRAVTLVTDKHAPDLLPSAHYLALVIAGAVEHGLPDAWIALLRSFRTASETPDAIAVRTLYDDVLARLRR